MKVVITLNYDSEGVWVVEVMLVNGFEMIEIPALGWARAVAVM